MNNIKTHAGYVAIVGRPNVGKSTLLNKILGYKLSITSSKPQTTRHRLLGIDTHDDFQVVYVDTPGLHEKTSTILNRYLNQTALHALREVDVIVLVVDCQYFTRGDAWVVSHLEHVAVPIIIAVNKIDKLKQRSDLFPLLTLFQEKIPSAEIIPISALVGDQVKVLQRAIEKHIPMADFLFPEDQISDRDENFLVAEIVREKLMRSLSEELPYGLTVAIEAFVDEPDLVRIAAIIWVEKDSHKPIVIGKQGDHLKKIGKLARRDIERHFNKKVYLQLWVKIKMGWTNDEKSLQQFGYGKH